MYCIVFGDIPNCISNNRCNTVLHCIPACAQLIRTLKYWQILQFNAAKTSVAFLKTRVSDRFNSAKKKWDDSPSTVAVIAYLPPPAQEVMFGPSSERASQSGFTDQNRTLEVGRLLPPHTQTPQRLLLVLPLGTQDDQISRPLTLPQPETRDL